MARARPGLEKAVNEILLRHGVDGKRLSFRQAERRTGLSPATISELAKGNARTPETIRRFAEGLGEDTGRLLLLAGFVPAEEPAITVPVSQDSHVLDSQESLLLERLATTLNRLPPGPARFIMHEQLRHTADLLDRFVELQSPSASSDPE